MPVPKRRHDSYGRPLPQLAPAEREVLVYSEPNLALRRYVVHLLETEYAEVFRRGTYATLQLSLVVENGQSTGRVDVQVTRHHRLKDA
jgi:hypothetical protein